MSLFQRRWNARILTGILLACFVIIYFRGQSQREYPWVLKDTVMNVTGKSYSYCDSETDSCGESFHPSWNYYLRLLNLSDDQVSQLTDADNRRILNKTPVFMTAFSDNHFAQAMESMESFQKLYPANRILIYDLGLRRSYAKRLEALPFVQSVRKFNFSMYPSYVQKMYEYRWKPLMLAEALREFEAVLYFDAHMLLKKGANLDRLLDQIRCQIDGKCDYYSSFLLGGTGHSIYAATDQRCFAYFPMNQTNAKRMEMGVACFMLTYYTKEVRSHLYKWLILCALEPGCMGPENADRFCKFGNDRWERYGGCHRFDQSILNILLAGRNQFDPKRYIVAFDHERS